MPPPMQAHAKPRLNQRMRPRERRAETVVGTARPAVVLRPGASVCSSALRRSTKDLVADVTGRLFRLHCTAPSSTNRVIHKHHPEHFLAAIVAISVPRSGDAEHIGRPNGVRLAALREVRRQLLVACASALLVGSRKGRVGVGRQPRTHARLQQLDLRCIVGCRGQATPVSLAPPPHGEMLCKPSSQPSAHGCAW